MKSTSRWGPDRIRDFASRQHLLGSPLRIRDRDGLEQGARVRVLRIGVNRPGGTHLDDPAEVHDRDAVAHELRRCQVRSEEHTSELQSHSDLVCRLLLEKKKKNNYY